MFRKIDKTSTFNDVLKQIIEKIQTGELQPGDALPAERILAEEFGISRPALREVLKSTLTSRHHSQRSRRCKLYCNGSPQLPDGTAVYPLSDV